MRMRPLVPTLHLVCSWLRFVRDTDRTRDVFVLNDRLLEIATSEETARVVEDFSQSPHGAEALRRRYRIERPNDAHLESLSPESLGAAYLRFMRRHAIAASDLPS